MKPITSLFEHDNAHQATAVRKNRGKTMLFLNYYKGRVVIRNGLATLKETITGKDEADLVKQLRAKKYEWITY